MQWSDVAGRDVSWLQHPRFPAVEQGRARGGFRRDGMGQPRPVEMEGRGRTPLVGRAPGEGSRAAVRVRASRPCRCVCPRRCVLIVILPVEGIGAGAVPSSSPPTPAYRAAAILLGELWRGGVWWAEPGAQERRM
jgi:hypothetical protein